MDDQIIKYREWICKTNAKCRTQNAQGVTKAACKTKTEQNKTALAEHSPGNMEGIALPKATGRSEKTRQVQEQKSMRKDPTKTRLG